MLSYATIFIGSIIVAVTALVLYRAIQGSSSSVLNSKVPLDLVTGPEIENNKAFGAIRDTAFPSGHVSHASPANMAKTHPALPVEDNVDWSVREKSSGCSLYNVDPLESPVKRRRNMGRLHREDRQEATGSAYKVSRKMKSDTSDTDDSGKPWGW